jgi:non-ribosomal peptide synthetase component F
VVQRIARSDYRRVSLKATQHGVTPFNLFLAALALYFGRINERDAVVVGVPTLNRNGRRFKETLGMFVGVMAVPVALVPAMTCAEFLTSVAASTRGVLRHPRYPLSELGRTLEMIRTGRDGLFDLLLSFERQDYKLLFGEAKMTNSRQVFAGTARYPLSATVCDFNEDEDVELVLEASEACFSADEAALLGPRVWQLVEALIDLPNAHIATLPLMPESEKARLLVGLHADVIYYPLAHPTTEPFIVQFERQVALRPQASAVVWDGGSLTYGELNLQANQLAGRLIAVGAGRDKIVALAIERSTDMVVSILAIAKAGAAFLPLDVDAPIARLADILKASEAIALLIQERSADRLNHLHPCTMAPGPHRPDFNIITGASAKRLGLCAVHIRIHGSTQRGHD